MKFKLNRLSIGAKLTALSFALVLVSFAAFTFVAITQMTRAQDEKSLAALKMQTEQVLDMMAVYDSSLKQTAQLASKALAARFSDAFVNDPGKTIVVGTTEAPTLSNGGHVLNNDFAFVDRFLAETGQYATIFARKGDDFVRVTTSHKKEDGSRAVGTMLDREGPAYKKMIAGETYNGKAKLWSKDYMTEYVPVKDKAGKVIAVLYIGFDFTEGLKALNAKIKAIKIGETGYFYALDAAPKSAGVLTVHPAKEGSSILEAKDSDGREFIKEMLAKKSGVIRYPWINKELGETAAREKIVVYGHFQPWNWVIGGGSYIEEFSRATVTLRNTLIACGVAAVLILSVLLYWTFRRLVSAPLKKAVDVATRVGAGDLTSRIRVRSSDETGQLLQALKDMNDNLKRIVVEVRTGSDGITTASQEIAAGNADLSARTEQQASSLEETASSMEELASTVKQNAENAKQANRLADEASQVAVQGGAVVGEVVQTMASINESSKKIADIIGVIDGIAFQTNILALNAAVEAARAGEQGRGFAVVASEVRTLAQRSAAAAKEIKALISDSVGKVEAGAKLVDNAGSTMNEIVASVKRVSDIVADIAAATGEQSSGIEQVNHAVTQMDQVTQQNAALVEEAAAAAESMREQAAALGREVAVFKVSADAAAVEAPREAAPMVERRGPDRAKNVARLPAKKEARTEPVSAEPRKTGTDDEWSEF